jgi:uncharacterized FlgJ-related protein
MKKFKNTMVQKKQSFFKKLLRNIKNLFIKKQKEKDWQIVKQFGIGVKDKRGIVVTINE